MYVSVIGLLYFFGLAEVNLWWQWYGFRYNNWSVLRECLAQISLDGGRRQLNVFLCGGDACMTDDFLNDIDVHAKVGQSSDARPSGCVDGDALATANLAECK